MKVHIWNAFASNNSGSYTLVGRFPEETFAAEVAAELARVSVEHEAWIQEQNQKGWGSAQGPSPLEAFVARHGLAARKDSDTGEDWPQHGGDNTPKVWALGHQVFIHHDYTLTLPAAFGEFFYKRGGRVEAELVHTHHALVGLFQLWFPYQERQGQDVPALALRVLDELYAEDGPLVQLAQVEPLPAWRVWEHSGEGDLTVGAAFQDLVAGFTAVDRIARAHGFNVRVKLFEAPSEGDPLAFLRPCVPLLPTRELFDVFLIQPGETPVEVVHVLEELRDLRYKEARALLDAAPVAVRTRLPKSVAEAMASRLQRAGATTELRPAQG